MSTVDNGRFRLIYRSQKHHYLWREHKTDSLVISDHSADDLSDRPESVVNTDDGVLYIDVERILERGGLTIYRHEHNGGTEFWVPLFKVEKGEIEKCSCITGLPTALKLLAQPEFEGCLEGRGMIVDFGDDDACALSAINVPCDKEARIS